MAHAAPSRFVCRRADICADGCATDARWRTRRFLPPVLLTDLLSFPPFREAKDLHSATIAGRRGSQIG